MEKRCSHGFTLTELLIVMGILVALALIGIAYFRGQIFKGNDAKRKSNIQRIQVAVEEYEKDHDCYPLPQYVVCDPGTGLVPYLNRVPCDPTTGSSYYYEYQDSSCPGWYRIYTNLENMDDESIYPQGIGPGTAFNYVASSPNAPAPATDEGGGGGGDETPPQTGFYACKSHVCVPINWNPDRPGPDCDPNFRSSNCYGQCPDLPDCVPQ